MNALRTPKKNALLVLEDGTIFKGKAAGASITTTGEICFNTAMNGYQELFTDPSYSGQIVVCTHVHIGNYGVMDSETESGAVKIAGLVCREFSANYSRNMAQGNIHDYFINEQKPVIYGIDTRKLVKHIRDKGAMNAILSTECDDPETLKKQLQSVPSMQGQELSSRVSCERAYEEGSPDASIRISVLDLGLKQNIVRCLTERGAKVKVFPAKSSFQELDSFNPHGFMISNGPGDPAVMSYAIETVKEALDSNKPIFGICLGHQILAEACGVKTYKMHNGHRGVNHPIQNLTTSKGEITSQNHGFAVDKDQLETSNLIEITHIHLNDKTVAGIRHKSKPAFSVQYHPESAPGPHDSRYLFDEFIDLINSQNTSA
jgi:carbamoyl-phosphate synthase small subunit